MKKPWNKPEIIILVKKETDSEILLGCKGGISNMNGEESGCNAYTFVYSGSSTRRICRGACK